MRRWLIILLMVLLPLQSSWAAMGLCACVDELLVPTAAHGEEVAATTGHAGDEHATPKGSCEPTCQLCHFAAQVTAETCEAVNNTEEERPSILPSSPLHGHIPDGLDRPNWQLAA